MCGILAVIRKGEKPLNLAACRRGLNWLSLRGPDLCAYEMWEERVFMGQTILSLTGRLKTDARHLVSATTRFKMALNGEIYNYRELKSKYLNSGVEFLGNGDSDSEVLVNLHDVLPSKEIPSLLDGMYAYAILDKQQRNIQICRDVQGEKSLYIYEGPDFIIISSEINPILLIVPSLTPEAQVLRDYFHTRHFMFLERTIYREIRQLLPGSIETLDLMSMKWKRQRPEKLSDWISLSQMEAYSKCSMEELTDELDHLMATCVRQMIPENQKYASVVSGGVDSSLISHYLLDCGSPDKLVAVNHMGKDRISSDLSGFEGILGQKIDVIQVDRREYRNEVPQCQKICGSPLLSHSFVGQAIQSAYVRKAGCRVLFGGDGADELFGGYSCYLKDSLNNGGYSPSPYTRYLDAEVEFEKNDNENLKLELANAWRESLRAYSHLENEKERAAQAMMYCDFMYQLPSVGLRGSDLMSLMWNVETRSVFIRRPIVKFALNLPLFAKAKRSRGVEPLLGAKPLLKNLFLRYFGRLLLTPKQGFAGFPNESGAYLGDVEDFITLEVLGIKSGSMKQEALSRDTLWKLINIEFLLREVL